MPELRATDLNCWLYLLSRSRMRNLGPMRLGVASRSCWAIQASVGEAVTAV